MTLVEQTTDEQMAAVGLSLFVRSTKYRLQSRPMRERLCFPRPGGDAQLGNSSSFRHEPQLTAEARAKRVADECHDRCTESRGSRADGGHGQWLMVRGQWQGNDGDDGGRGSETQPCSVPCATRFHSRVSAPRSPFRQARLLFSMTSLLPRLLMEEALAD